MKNLNELVGCIKRIKTVNTVGERVIDAMIVDYKYNPDTTINKQHKLDYISTTGDAGSMYVNDKTTYTNITTSEHVKKYLKLIKESIQRRKVAYEQYLVERKNIEALTVELLQGNNAMSKESFEDKLVSDFAKRNIKVSHRDTKGGNIELTFAINKGVGLEVTLRKHYIKDMRVKTYQYTGKFINELDFITVKSNGSPWVDIKNKETYEEFIEKYKVLDFSDKGLIKFLEENDMSFSESVSLIRENDDSVYVKSTYISALRKNKDKILLNEDAINLMLDFSDFIL